MVNLEKFFNPSSIAIVGASDEPGKIGHILARNLLELGYAGKIFLVNPKHENILGKKSYLSLGAVAEKIDLAIIVIPAGLVEKVIKEGCAKVNNFVIISSGFSEIGPEGKEREKKLIALAKEKKLNILGPNCLGFIVPALKLNASFARGLSHAGETAFISQSGALIASIMDMAEKERIGFSRIISIGNKMRIDETDILEYLEKDEKTRSIGMYLEGVKNGAKFLEVAARVSVQKPIVILKAGRNEKSRKAIASHTGALAGDNQIMAAAFKKAGILSADSLEEFMDILELTAFLNLEKSSKGDSVIITNAGGVGVLATDAFDRKKIKLAVLPEEIKNKLREFLPKESSVENPIDLLGDALEDRYEKTLNALKEEKGGENIICILTPQIQTPVAKITQKIIDFKKQSRKNLLAVFVGGEKTEEFSIKLKNNKIPTFLFPERAVKALNKYFSFKEARKTIGENTAFQPDESRRKKTRDLLDEIKKKNRQILVFSEAKEIMNLYGIQTVNHWILNPEGNWDKNFSYPATVKVDSDKVLHKTDKKGLILNLKNAKELKEAVAEIRHNFPGEKIIVQPMISGGTELILGIKKDEIFGPVLVFGLGGIYTEIFQAVDFAIPYFGKEEIKDILLKGKSGFLFRETRGKVACDLEEIAQIILKLQSLALEIDQIKELDINPLISPGGNGPALAVDIKIII